MKSQGKRVKQQERLLAECALPQAPMAMPEQTLTHERSRRALGGLFALWFVWR